MRDRFGLQLVRGSRQMEALVIDRIQADAVLSLFHGVGQLTQRAPERWRQRVSSMLALR
jgi:hypothetical protein